MEPRPHRDRFRPPKRFLQHIDMSQRSDVCFKMADEEGVISNEVKALLLPATPNEIRNEVDILLSDLIVRLKQLLFNSLLCAYYVGFIPLQFAEVSTIYTY